MSTKLSRKGTEDLHIVIPTEWKTFIEKRAERNKRSLSLETREALRMVYKLTWPDETNTDIILPEGLR